jgi:DNA-binding NtrC family response regulator/GGDEF domain-containing protein/HAMP domain-containing protein
LAWAGGVSQGVPEARAVWVDPREVVIDGDSSEWRGDAPAEVVIDRVEQFVVLTSREPRARWSGPDDASVQLWIGWNEQDLILGGLILDDVEDHDSERWFHGDSLELFVNVRDREPQWGNDDYQVMLAPDWEERPWGVYPRSGQVHGSGTASHGGFGGVEVASVPLLEGYRFEARIPWRNFDGYSPEAGAELPLNFAVCDRDGPQTGGGTPLDSYGTWTGESDIASYADRRGRLWLEGGGAVASERDEVDPAAGRASRRPLMLLLLGATYGLALFTRGFWRSSRARRVGVIAAAAVLAISAALAVAARVSREGELEERRAAVVGYWSEFDGVLSSGALGHPEPAELVADVETLLSGGSIGPRARASYAHLAPAGARSLPAERTTRRGIPFEPFERADESADDRGWSLAPGEVAVLPLPSLETIEAVHLVTRVSDRSFLEVDGERPVLSVELYHQGVSLPGSYDVRHRQDVHYEEDDHRDHPGLEPAFHLAGGRFGRVHADGLLLELNAPGEVDQVVVRHVGHGYSVRLVAVSVRRFAEPDQAPAGLRTNAEGGWEWGGWREEMVAEVTPIGRAPKRTEPGSVFESIRIGSESVGSVRLLDKTPIARATRWDFLPFAALGGVAPFLVALFAEWLATRRRIRGKLAVGFAVSSAVPLLALTLLLEASLTQEHEVNESERTQAALERAERELEAEEAALEREARRLLRIAELEASVAGEFPRTPDVLDSWWGAPEGALRVLEHTRSDGRRVRIGSGLGWREVPAAYELRSGLVRPWGRLLVAGVAHTASGAEQPLTVFVARAPQVLDSADTAAAGLSMVGAGRDPAPRVADLAPAGSREIRRPVFGPDPGELAGVLVVSGRERGIPVLADYSLTDLLLAAGITAVFTALLFAGILTGHIVGPIERLDRAVREGRSSSVEPAVPDEIGHLTSAIRSVTSELSHRVSQLEALQLAHERLSSRLDSEQAREAVLDFFRRQTSATSAWLAWAGERGDQPRLFAEGGRDLSLPADSELFHAALVAEQVEHRSTGAAGGELTEAERLLLGPVEGVLCLPLLAAGDCRGAIVLGLRTADAPTDLSFLRTAAAQAAIVLENARLYHQAVSDTVTGFLSDPGFRQRLTEEIQRAEEQPEAGVVLVQLRLTDLSEDDERAADRLREAARRMRLAVRGLALFGRSGSADLKVAVPWTGAAPSTAAIEQRVADRVAAGPWPDGEPVTGLHTSSAAWPADGPSARFVTHVLEERLMEVRQTAPMKSSLEDSLPPDFVVASPVMIELLDTVRRIAEQEATVLISGETGVGKDRIAELVHNWSPRRAGPLVHVHCPSLSEALLEDELFGHEVGAFTGAHSRRVGPFEYAKGGTVVLDEVVGLSAEGQVALLRLLETREVLPLGATQPVPLDVRFVVTTSRDLALEVERGNFRPDLYFRLNVAQVSVPPLRLRRADLPDLVASVVRKFNASSALPVTGVDARVLDVLFDHAWPGNLRELENVLARGLILSAGGELAPEHVQLEPGEATEVPVEAGLNPRQEALLGELALGARISSTEHSDHSGVSTRTALRDLMELVELGYLVREGEKRGTRFRRRERPRGAAAGQ